MVPQNNSAPKNMTVQGFQNDMTGFVEHIKGVTTPDAVTGRARFPEFRVTDPIKDKLERAAGRCEQGDLGEAFSLLDAAITHFSNQQASYARRTLLPELKADFDGMIREVKKGDDDDLVATVRNAVTAYEILVGEERFELSDASRLYWAAIDALDGADREYANRKESRRLEKQQADSRRRADEAAKARQHTASVGRTLKNLVSTL